MDVLRAADESDRAEAVAVAVERGVGRLDEARIVGEAGCSTPSLTMDQILAESEQL